MMTELLTQCGADTYCTTLEDTFLQTVNLFMDVDKLIEYDKKGKAWFSMFDIQDCFWTEEDRDEFLRLIKINWKVFKRDIYTTKGNIFKNEKGKALISRSGLMKILIYSNTEIAHKFRRKYLHTLFGNTFDTDIYLINCSIYLFRYRSMRAQFNELLSLLDADNAIQCYERTLWLELRKIILDSLITDK